MLTLESSTLTRKRLTELLAEARARTVLLVSPLSEDAIRLQPDEAVNSVLYELEQIIGFEHQWLAQSPGSLPKLESYDAWFDLMLEVREQSLERLDSVDDQSSPPSLENRCRMLLEHEYRRNEAILETLQLQNDYRAPRRFILPRG